MYIINTIPHGKCFVQYLCTRCFCIRNLTRSLRSLVRFLTRQQLVRKYRTPALSMKYSLCITILKYHSWYLCKISLLIMLLPIQMVRNIQKWQISFGERRLKNEWLFGNIPTVKTRLPFQTVRPFLKYST